jgi:hypothetical protein
VSKKTKDFTDVELSAYQVKLHAACLAETTTMIEAHFSEVPFAA